MKKLILTIFFCFIFVFLSYRAEASFYRDKIFIGENRVIYNYFFTITDFTSEEDISGKIIRKSFPFKKKVNLLIIVEVPSNLYLEEQYYLWEKLEKFKILMGKFKYQYSIKFNGNLNKKSSTYKVHIYYQ